LVLGFQKTYRWYIRYTTSIDTPRQQIHPALLFIYNEVYQQTIYINLELTDNFNVAFPNKRVPNGFIDKTKTRLGITYTNFHDERHSISVIPSVPIIEDALKQYPYLNLFEIKKGVTPEMIADYLNSDAQYKRLVTTPESFNKIIAAAITNEQLQWLFNNFFLYLDEVHCYVTDSFREDILIPFDEDLIWEFKDMAMGSASPFLFSDPKILALPHYKILFKEKFGKITIVNEHDPKAVLLHMLKTPEMFPGNVYIFYPSVTSSGEVVMSAGVTDVNIYCRDERRNIENLKEASVFHKELPRKKEFKKFNFFTTRYNEGWNLDEDETATIILVTDVHQPHTMIGIPYKGYQAVGRSKVTPNKIYHVTNNLCKGDMRTFEEIQSSALFNATNHIKYHNHHIKLCNTESFADDGKIVDLVKPFSRLDGSNYRVRYPMKHDQLICAAWCREHYNNADTIKKTWESINYDTEFKKFDLEPVVRERKSQEEINMQIVERLEEFKINKSQYEYGVVTETIRGYEEECPILFEAYEQLGLKEIRNLNYNNKAMKAKLIQTSNQNAEAKLRLMLIDEYQLGERYIRKDMKIKLQEFYDKLRIRKADGKREIATVEKLKELGLFELHQCKKEDDAGNLKPAYEITKLNFIVKEAA
jgi:hypothetical protein